MIVERIAYIVIVFTLVLFAACSDNCKKFHTALDVNTYADVPGITTEEIAAIEAIKAKRDTLYYGNLFETTSIRHFDDSFIGFAVELFDFIGNFFGITFIPRYYDDMDDVPSEDVSAAKVDIIYGISDNIRFDEQYHKSTPIGEHRLCAYTLADAEKIRDVNDIVGRKIGFLKYLAIDETIARYYPDLKVEYVIVPTLTDVPKMLRSGEIDFLLTGIELETFFSEQDNSIKMQQFFSPIYVPFSVATSKDELAPIISVFNKYLNDADGIKKVSGFYEKGRKEYFKDRLRKSLTNDERAYMDSLMMSGGVVSVGFMHDAYPASFYNRIEHEYQGVAPKILAEITELTGIKFQETVTDCSTSLANLVLKLKDGEISMVTHLIYSDSRKNDYLWSDIPYLSSKFALLSKIDFPSLDKYQVYYHRVGVIGKSVHAEKFDSLFPNHKHKTVFASGKDAFDALENGDLCMVMLTESMLWAMTNYYGKSNFKVNIAFDDRQEALLGYNNNEKHLCSIVDKAMRFVDVENIRENWINRTFDYSKVFLRQRLLYMYILSFVGIATVIILLFMFIKNKKLGVNLQHESAKFSTIFSTIPDIGFYIDTNLRYVNVNEAFKRFAGKTDVEIIGKGDDDVFAGKKEMIGYFTEINMKALRERNTIVVHETVKTADGVELFLETIKTPLFQNGILMGVIGMARDITTHKAAEAKAVEASVEKGRFLANMSHEIRTPLNAIVGMSDLLIMECLTGRQLNYVKDICMASHSLLSIVNDILDISKIEAGKLEICSIDYDFREFIANLVSMFKFMARKKGLGFGHENVCELPKCIYGDDVRLRQVLINIFANAVNYTSSGYVDFRVSPTERKLIFEIRDTGVGIKPEDIDTIFSPFKRFESDKNRNIQGTGLGLPISKNFVELMGGTIEISSKYGEGSTFTVTIPRADGDESKIKRIDIESKAKIIFKAPDARILVVDDNSLNLKVAYRLLNLYNISAELASSGAEAVSAVQNAKYDMVFMDHMMPEMDGIETTAKIRALGEQFAQLPIIALTANATRGVQDIFISSGLDDYLSKPIELDKLSDMLQKWIPKEKITTEVSVGVKKEVKDVVKEDAINKIVSVDRSSQDVFWRMVAKISHINVEVGKNRVAGIEEMYKETLELFYNKLKDDLKRLDYLFSGKDMSDFTILIHGMKSSLSTIGAMELSRVALELEKASKDGDTELCEKILPKFLEELDDLHEQIAEACKFERQSQKIVKGDIAFLRENAKIAADAAAAYDGDGAVKALEKLLGYDYGAETNEALKSVHESLKSFDFDGAITRLKQLQ